MRIVVCGSREYTNVDAVRRVLTEYVPDTPGGVRVLHGACRGADAIAAGVARDLGFWVYAYEADWKKHGKAAGPLRNRRMLDQKPDLVIAFGDGHGTRDTVTEAVLRGIEVRREP